MRDEKLLTYSPVKNFSVLRALQAFEAAVIAVLDRCNDKKAAKTDMEYRQMLCVKNTTEKNYGNKSKNFVEKSVILSYR